MRLLVTVCIDEGFVILAAIMREYYSLARIKLGCEVRVVDLETEAKPEGI
jgi:hypothetical protein